MGPRIFTALLFGVFWVGAGQAQQVPLADGALTVVDEITCFGT